MAGLVPAISIRRARHCLPKRVAGTSPAMTTERKSVIREPPSINSSGRQGGLDETSRRGLALLLWAGVAHAEDADLVLLNGKIVTLAARDDVQEALAIRDGKVLAVGRSDEMRKRAAPSTTIVDLGGRTVIPGFINRTCMPCGPGCSLVARSTGPGSGPSRKPWRGSPPRRADPARPVDCRGRRVDRGSSSPKSAAQHKPALCRQPVTTRPTFSCSIGPRYCHRQSPKHEDRERSGCAACWQTRARRERNTDGLDPRQQPDDHGAVRPASAADLRGENRWDDRLFPRTQPRWTDRRPRPRRLQPATERVPGFVQGLAGRRLHASRALQPVRPAPNSELEDFKSAVQMLPMRFGDDMLRFNGIGENVTWGSYNNDNMSDAQKEQLYQVAKWAADRGLTLTIHWAERPLGRKSAGRLRSGDP